MRRMLSGPVLPAVLAVIAVGCNGDPLNEYRPTAADLTHGWREFLAGARDIVGEYGNLDVPSVVFTYATDCRDEASFWTTLEAGLLAANWTSAPGRQDGERRYQRRSPHGTMKAARVRTLPDRRIRVVWLHATSDRAGDPNGQNAQWAERKLWPMLDGK